MYKIKPKRQSDALFICRHILTYFNVKHTRIHVDRFLSDHLDYPSLLAVKDTLSEYGIESAAIRKGDYSYSDFETPFICAIQQEDWPNPAFTVVSECTADRVTYLDPLSGKEKTGSLDTFEQMDKEIVLLLDGEHKKDEAAYTVNQQQEITEYFISRIPLYAFSLVVLLSLIFQLKTNALWIFPAFLLTSTAGLLISLLLVWHEVDAYNPFIKEVCGGSNRKKLNCNAVLSSTGSRFLGISWSVWGFSYFVTFFISQVIFSSQISYIQLWAILSLGVLVYVPYSLYYQGRVVRQWCPLCLGIQAVIVINAVLAALFLYQKNDSPSIDFLPIANIFFLGVAILLLTYYAIPLLKKAREARNYEKRWKRLRFNPDIFQSLLEKSTPVTVSPEGLGILVGNPDARNEIIKVCNPYCGPCSEAHAVLERIIKNNSDVKLRVIFNALGADWDKRTPPARHFLFLDEKHGAVLLHKALNVWYSATEKNYEKFALQFPTDNELLKYNEKIFEMRKWCDDMKIRATPTIFINGHELPESYRIAELKNFF